MRIVVYAISWNEECMLPFFLRHYDFADKIVIYDNMSTDRTCEIARAHPKVELRQYDSGETIDEHKYVDIKSRAWAGEAADWVISVDMDEFLYHENLLAYLALYTTSGITLVYPSGYQMVYDNDEFPVDDGRQLTEICKNGVFMEGCSKVCCFNPSAISDMNYDIGCHNCHPTGCPIWWDPMRPIKLLHYHYIGRNYQFNRCQMKYTRRTPEAIIYGWGATLDDDRAIKYRVYSEVLAKSVQVI